MIKWRVVQKRSGEPNRIHEVEIEKGYKRIEGSEPKTVENVCDLIIEMLEGGFLEDNEQGRVLWFSIEELGKKN